MNDPRSPFLSVFLEAAPYVVRARDQVVVIWIDADLGAEHLPNLAEELSLLHAMGQRLVLVPDGHPDQIQPLAAQDQAAAAARNDAELRRWIDLLSRGWVGIPERAYRLSVLHGNIVAGRRVGVRDGVDYGHMGVVRGVDAERAGQLLAAGHVLLLGGAVTGTTGLNLWLRPLDVAVAAARALSAAKLLLVSAVPPPAPQLPAEWTSQELAAARACATGRSALLLEASAEALATGVPRVHWVDGRRRGAVIEELLSRRGCGLMATTDPSAAVTGVGADEIGELAALIARFEPEGALKPRSRQLLEAELAGFRVVKVDGRIAACGLLKLDGAGNALIESVAVRPDDQGEGRGTRLMRALEREALEGGAVCVYVLTTTAEEWFVDRGYDRCDVEDAPEFVQAAFRPQRASKLLRKNLREAAATRPA